MDSNSRSFISRHEFSIRRVHSLSGLIPVGAFLCMHLLTNASVLGGAQLFQDNVDRIHALGPALVVVEWLFIFFPLLFHAAVGVIIATQCEPNSGAYRYGSNIRYTLQRATAWIALFFILWHVFHMHGWLPMESLKEKIAETGYGAQFDPDHATSSAAAATSSILIKGLYAIGVLSCVYHFANGLWTMGITWGLWTSPASQRRANYVCGAIGVALAVAGLGALVGLGKVDREDARAMEDVREFYRNQEKSNIEHLMSTRGKR